jgi:hypothetical protein
MPTLPKVLAAATAILAVIELVRGQPLVRWRRRQEHPLQTRGRTLSLLLVASEHASFELHAANLGYVLIGLAWSFCLAPPSSRPARTLVARAARRPQLGRLSQLPARLEGSWAMRSLAERLDPDERCVIVPSTPATPWSPSGVTAARASSPTVPACVGLASAAGGAWSGRSRG